ncbi:hypothetical protein BH09BAC3_BH09BAC3_03680 [soil metagenome]
MRGSILFSFVFYSFMTFGQNGETGTKSKNIEELAPKRFISSIGLFVGPSFLYPALLINNTYQSSGSKFGYSFGISIIHSVTRFDIEAKVISDHKQFQLVNYHDPGNPSSKSTYDLTNNYLSFILIPKYTLDRKGHFKIGIGGYLSFLQKSQWIIAVMNAGVSNFLGTMDSSEYYEPTDFGVVSSISYQYRINKAYSFGVELLNTNGLKTIINSSYSASMVAVPIERNNNINLTFFFNIKLRNN